MQLPRASLKGPAGIVGNRYGNRFAAMGAIVLDGCIEIEFTIAFNHLRRPGIAVCPAKSLTFRGDPRFVQCTMSVDEKQSQSCITYPSRGGIASS